MSVRQLEWHAVEKVWGRRDFPAVFGDASEFEEPVGEIWFADDADAPLMVKHLFTSAKLSIQVHPSDEKAVALGHARGKDEAWFVLSAEPGATIGAGFDRALTPGELRTASQDGSIEEMMTWHSVKPGDFFYVPAGTVHALGAGLSLVEIQQNVDLTYRLYDYGRPRSLQLEEGLAVSQPGPYVSRKGRSVSAKRDVLVEGPKFVIERLYGTSRDQVRASERDRVWLVPITDGCIVEDKALLAGTVWQADDTANVDLGPDDCLLVAYPGHQVL